jgi:hypothetical protein
MALLHTAFLHSAKNVSDNVRAWFDELTTSGDEPFALSLSKGPGQGCWIEYKRVHGSAQEPPKVGRVMALLHTPFSCVYEVSARPVQRIVPDMGAGRALPCR